MCSYMHSRLRRVLRTSFSTVQSARQPEAIVINLSLSNSRAVTLLPFDNATCLIVIRSNAAESQSTQGEIFDKVRGRGSTCVLRSESLHPVVDTSQDIWQDIIWTSGPVLEVLNKEWTIQLTAMPRRSRSSPNVEGRRFLPPGPLSLVLCELVSSPVVVEGGDRELVKAPNGGGGAPKK